MTVLQCRRRADLILAQNLVRWTDLVDWVVSSRLVVENWTKYLHAYKKLDWNSRSWGIPGRWCNAFINQRPSLHYSSNRLRNRAVGDSPSVFDHRCLRSVGKIWWDDVVRNLKFRLWVLGRKVCYLEEAVNENTRVVESFYAFLVVRCSLKQVMVGRWVQVVR